MKTKEEVAKEVFRGLDKIQESLLIDSRATKEVNAFNQVAYDILEVAKLALRGQYHTPIK